MFFSNVSITSTIYEPFTVWKVSKYGVFSGPYFSVFEIYGVNLPIQFQYGEKRTWNTPFLYTFHAVCQIVVTAKMSHCQNWAPTKLVFCKSIVITASQVITCSSFVFSNKHFVIICVLIKRLNLQESIHNGNFI